MADRAAGPLWGSDATAPGPCLRRGGAPGVVSPASLAADGFGLLMEDFRFVLSESVQRQNVSETGRPHRLHACYFRSARGAHTRAPEKPRQHDADQQSGLRSPARLRDADQQGC